MIFNGFHHIGLITDDVERSLTFYIEGLKGEITFSFPMGDSGKTIYLVELGQNAVVEIIPGSHSEAESNARWAHIALATDDTRAAYQLALDAGAVTRSEPKDLLLGTMAVTNAFVYGPDGEVIEFFQVRHPED